MGAKADKITLVCTSLAAVYPPVSASRCDGDRSNPAAASRSNGSGRNQVSNVQLVQLMGLG